MTTPVLDNFDVYNVTLGVDGLAILSIGTLVASGVAVTNQTVPGSDVLGTVSNDAYSTVSAGVTTTYNYFGSGLGVVLPSVLKGIFVGSTTKNGVVSYFVFFPHGSSLTSLANVGVLIGRPATGSSAGQYNTATDAVGCLLGGTLLLTPDGERAVEMLTPGDLVTTSSGEHLPIRWIGRSTMSRFGTDRSHVLPIRIQAGALADKVPTRDLLVSPDHAMFIGDILVQAGALVNGVSITLETDVSPIFSYYHVELEHHSLILAEGTPTETFVDNIDRMNFDNGDEYQEPSGENRSVPEMDYPRIKSARQVPLFVKERIAARLPFVTGVSAAAA